MHRNTRVVYHLALGVAAALVTSLTIPQVALTEITKDADVSNSHNGTFVSADGNSFTMKDESGNEHSHTLAPGATVTDPNGQPCQLSDIKAGQKITVTTKEGDPKVATKVICVI